MIWAGRMTSKTEAVGDTNVVSIFPALVPGEYGGPGDDGGLPGGTSADGGGVSGVGGVSGIGVVSICRPRGAACKPEARWRTAWVAPCPTAIDGSATANPNVNSKKAIYRAGTPRND
jgi:hypothetical protein